MYNKVLIILGLIILTSNPITAKTDTKVTGKVIEKTTGEVLPFATVTIQSKEKKVLGGTYTSEDGKFSLNNIAEGEQSVKVSFIGYKDTTIEAFIEYIGTVCDLGTIALNPNARQLSAAVVTSKVPVIEQKLDKIVMNVSEAVHTQGSNALEVLRKAPGISIDPSGNILLNGQAAQIWIDNRPSNLTGEDLTTLLNATDGSTIDKIEIMAHPSSKYDASGSGGIINIKTKKNFLKGLNGSVRLASNAGYHDRVYAGANASLNANYRSEKNNTFVLLSPRYDERKMELSSETYNSNTFLSSLTSMNFYQNSQNFKIGNDYYMNKKNIFGVILYGVTRDMNDNSLDESGSKFFTDGTLSKRTDTKLKDTRSFDNISGNMNYSYMIKDGNELTLNMDYGYFDIANNAWQDNRNFNGSGIELNPINFRSTSLQYINLVSFKTDYEKIIWKSAKLETGFKVAQSTTNNDLVREDLVSGTWQNNSQLSSKFDYRENISAAYLSITKQINKKFVGKAGLRGEYTDSKGNWISSGTSTSKGYMNFFPNLYVGYTPTKDMRVSFSYSLRISRPNYSQLNPFRQYVDAQSSLEGNPELDPEMTHELTLTAGYKQHLNFTFLYQQNNNKIIQNPYFDELTAHKKLVWENFGTQKLVGVVLSVTEYPLVKWLYLNFNAIAANIHNRGAAGFTSHSIFAQGNLGLTMLLPKSTKFEVNSTFQSGLPYGYFEVLPQGQVSLSIKKGMLKNRADLAINVNDIFDTQHERIRMKDYAISEYKLNQRNLTRNLTVSFSYKFGQGKAARQRKVGVQDEAGRVGNQ